MINLDVRIVEPLPPRLPAPAAPDWRRFAGTWVPLFDFAMARYSLAGAVLIAVDLSSARHSKIHGPEWHDRELRHRGFELIDDATAWAYLSEVYRSMRMEAK
jgi:hypothetical protein